MKRLYLCNGCACGKDVPIDCFLLDGACHYTDDERFSASKTFSKSMPKTKWVNVDGSLEREVLDTCETLKALIG